MCWWWTRCSRHLRIAKLKTQYYGNGFKRENAKVTRIDKSKEEVVVELLEAAVPIPITVKMDSVKVIRRETDDESGAAEREAEEDEI